MNKIFSVSLSLLLCLWVVSLFTSCNSSREEITYPKDVIIKEKDLIPEGLAYDKRTWITYVGSTYKRKIIQIDSSGKIQDFIPPETENLWSPLGMEVDENRNLLWVVTDHAYEVMPLIHPDTTGDWMCALVSIDLTTKVIKKYILNSPQAGLNDLTIAGNGDIYMTESLNNQIYVLKNQGESLQLFLQLTDYTFPNGITDDEESGWLFVATQQGILKIDPRTKEYSLMEAHQIDAKSIDGLALYDNYLIGHQSTKISKFFLNDEKTEITGSEVIDSGPEFDGSTTGEIGNGYYIYIVNSQISSGIDREKRTVKPPDSLEEVIIRKIKI